MPHKRRHFIILFSQSLLSSPDLSENSILNPGALKLYRDTPHTYRQLALDCVTASLRVDGQFIPGIYLLTLCCCFSSWLASLWCNWARQRLNSRWRCYTLLCVNSFLTETAKSLQKNETDIVRRLPHTVERVGNFRTNLLDWKRWHTQASPHWIRSTHTTRLRTENERVSERDYSHTHVSNAFTAHDQACWTQVW